MNPDQFHAKAFPLLRQAFEEKKIEVIHGWGDFNENGGFSRALAEKACEWLESSGERLPIWVNHGDSNNIQDLGPLALFAQGDDPESEVYHLDLLRKAGVRYYWVGHLNPFPVLGGDPLRASEALTSVNLDQPGRFRFPARILQSLYRVFRWSFVIKMVHKLGWQYLPDNRLVFQHTFRDGSRGWVFQRSGRWERDGWDAFSELISDESLDRACRERAAIIVYTHLGKGTLQPRAKELLLKVASRKDVWVTSVHQLLDAAVSCVTPEASLFQGGQTEKRGESR